MLARKHRMAALLLGTMGTLPMFAQTPLTLAECQERARQNYPQARQLALAERSGQYSLENAAKGTLPQLALNGQAQLQSEVTSLPVELPGLDVPRVSRDQYKVFAELNQPLTNGAVVRRQKDLIRANTAAERQKMEVELYKINERVNQLYFGILLADAQRQQVESLKKDVDVGLNKTRAAIANGTALKSSADQFEAERLKVGQRELELAATRRGFLDMLGLFIGRELSESTRLEPPPAPALSADIRRPELGLFDTQRRTFDAQNQLLTAQNRPRLSLFAQGGYGRPALNLLSNTFDLYAIGGLRLNWNLSNFYTLKNSRELLAVGQSTLDAQRETFLFNTRLSMRQQESEVEKYRALVASDERIIALRQRIKATADTQLELGTLTANDYLTYVNAEDQARQNLLLHRMQLLMAQYGYQTLTGDVASTH